MSLFDDALGFCSRFDLTLEELEHRLLEAEPTGGRYFKESGERSGYMLPLYFVTVALVMKNTKSILEIGTGSGKTTILLSDLFPTAIVYTMDIPENDRDYKKLAWRKDEMKRFRSNMNRTNVVFVEKNSFLLPFLEIPKKHDLIYVNGGHLYPAVAWDIMFAYSHLRTGGFLFMHDYGPKMDVKKVVDYVKNIIDEEVGLLPSVLRLPESKTAWLRKQ